MKYLKNTYMFLPLYQDCVLILKHSPGYHDPQIEGWKRRRRWESAKRWSRWWPFVPQLPDHNSQAFSACTQCTAPLCDDCIFEYEGLILEDGREFSRKVVSLLFPIVSTFELCERLFSALWAVFLHHRRHHHHHLRSSFIHFRIFLFQRIFHLLKF